MSGVRYVLDQASFQDVDALPSPAFTALIGQLSKIVLRLLRICMAQRNSKARELIRDGIGPEIEELYMALTASSFEIPKNILPMNDSQREHWYGKMKHAKHSGESKDPGTGERVVPAHPLSESLVREVALLTRERQEALRELLGGGSHALPLRQLKGDLALAFLALAKSQLETLRGLLNVSAQLREAGAWQLIARIDSELHPPMKSFSQDFPNHLTTLFKHEDEFRSTVDSIAFRSKASRQRRRR